MVNSSLLFRKGNSTNNTANDMEGLETIALAIYIRNLDLFSGSWLLIFYFLAQRIIEE